MLLTVSIPKDLLCVICITFVDQLLLWRASLTHPMSCCHCLSFNLLVWRGPLPSPLLLTFHCISVRGVFRNIFDQKFCRCLYYVGHRSAHSNFPRRHVRRVRVFSMRLARHLRRSMRTLSLTGHSVMSFPFFKSAFDTWSVSR